MEHFDHRKDVLLQPPVTLTPLYLLDINGLSFDGVMDENLNENPMASTKRQCSALLNVFLYALSLSTTFGDLQLPQCLLFASVWQI